MPSLFHTTYQGSNAADTIELGFIARAVDAHAAQRPSSLHLHTAASFPQQLHEAAGSHVQIHRHTKPRGWFEKSERGGVWLRCCFQGSGHGAKQFNAAPLQPSQARARPRDAAHSHTAPTPLFTHLGIATVRRSLIVGSVTQARHIAPERPPQSRSQFRVQLLIGQEHTLAARSTTDFYTVLFGWREEG